MKEKFLSRFTPSIMSPEALEATFVQRESLAERIIELIRNSVLTSSKHHTLVIGPRGIGKTHLIALIYHRLQKMGDLGDRLLIAWLREEEWGVTSFLDLLLRIFRALSVKNSDPALAKTLETLYDMPQDIAERAAATLLKDFVGSRTLLVLVENLDDMFGGLGDEEQKRLRAYLQENQFCTILATAQSLFNGVSLQQSPFYGFFRISHLEELTLEEATRLLVNIAKFVGDNELAAFIEKPTGRARIRAVHHLAGGNHRVYVIFSQFLTHESLDALVEPFIQMLDDLTPYYQGRMIWLSSQQRKIMEFLCDRRRAVPVKEIAQRCFMSHQTASSQLKDLRGKGYVRSAAIGRESYYELREPLMRLCIEVKKNRGEPIRLLVDFLRLWHSRTELRERLAGLQGNATIEQEYLLHAVKANEEEPEDFRVVACLKDCKKYASKGDYARALQAAEELVAIRGEGRDWADQGHYLCHLQRWADAVAACEKAVELDPNDVQAWFYQGWALDCLKRHEEALASFNKAIELSPNDPGYWDDRGIALRNLGRYDDALASFNEVVKLDPQNKRGWLHRGLLLDRLGRYDDALFSFDKLIELDSKDEHAWLHRSFALEDLGRPEDALSAVDRVIRLDSSNVGAWLHRGLILEVLGRHEDALDSFDKVVEIDSKNAEAWHRKGIIQGNLGRYDEALMSCDKAIQLGKQSSYVLFDRAEALLALNQWEKGRAALEEAFQHFTTADKSYTGDTGAILGNLFKTTKDAARWRACIEMMIELYDKHQALAVVGKGLVENVPVIVSPTASNVAARMWLDTWSALASNRTEFELPLRLLNVAVRYRETHDQRTLLELPIEERTLLEPLLSVDRSDELQAASSSLARSTRQGKNQRRRGRKTKTQGTHVH